MFAVGTFGVLALIGLVVVLRAITRVVVNAIFRFQDWRVERRYRNHWRDGQLPRADIRPAQRRGRR